MTAEATPFRSAIAARAFLAATHEFDIEAVLRCFRPDAVIDDPSTGESFEGIEGVQDYVMRFFVGYRTRSRVISVDRLEGDRARLRVDFTGDFGHEIGRLDVVTDKHGRILRIDADLE
ncbi:nuclear transport factor 2 family protein [Palleronia sp. LCG004]|uniref:nuclear transport factor 2 family protein n=1 Tax=Palleronia sp. LCG004 TaxID=3079304 RepID=UPI00294263BC|nr:nuclear transport factor 2 family protein [Palleronia sp. LCG004]WOI57889.1 nuclear transport factor 2 family protein [Palleronia sp. LCG004]